MNNIAKMIAKGFALSGLLTLALFGLSASASAKTPGALEEMKINIPFSFNAGEKQLPAGQYEFTMPSEHVMLIRGDDGRSKTFLLTWDTDSTTPKRQSEMTFKQIGNQYFLANLSVAGENDGVQIPESRSERRLEQRKSEQAYAVVSGQ